MAETVLVGRLDNNKRIEVASGTSIVSAIREAGFSPAENEEVQDLEGNKYDGTEEVRTGKSYFLVQRVKSGV